LRDFGFHEVDRNREFGGHASLVALHGRLRDLDALNRAGCGFAAVRAEMRGGRRDELRDTGFHIGLTRLR
jgi:hypothetical protein